MVTKGEMLDRIFNHIDELNLTKKMRKLFVKNNMNVADLTELRQRNESDYNIWLKMYKRNHRLIQFSTFIILER